MLKHIDIDERRKAGAKGFTLIELLVVIIILGILAAVVVFAVGGITDKGETSACKTDKRTLTTAIQAWNAQETNGQDWPPSEQALVDEEFIDELSAYHNLNNTAADGSTKPGVVAVAGGKCA